MTCFRVGMRMGEPQLPSLLVAHHRPGFYLRVITEGQVTAGDEIVRTRAGRTRSAWPTSTRCSTCPATTPSGWRRPWTSLR